MNQTQLEQESPDVDKQTSAEIFIVCEQSLSYELKQKNDLQRKELDVYNKQRIIDKLLQQVKVQAERAESLINKTANWLIVSQCEKVRLSIQEGFKLLSFYTFISLNGRDIIIRML